MTETSETCRIRGEALRESWNIFASAVYRFVAETPNASGWTTVAHSPEYQIPGLRKLIWTNEFALDEQIKEARGQLVQQLLKDGWEIVSVDTDGEVQWLKRQKNQQAAQVSGTPADLLAQLASLRDAGVLTEEEFQNKKAEILKRM